LGVHQKIKLFEIGGESSPETWETRLFQLLEQTSSIARHHGTGLFHFDRKVTSACLGQIASEIRTRKMGVRFSVDSEIQSGEIDLTKPLRQAGCVAASFLVGSGSQRLVDSNYRPVFSTLDAERMLRTCAHAGIYTVAELAYPHPLEDRHTRAETVRLMMRSRPHAARVRPFGHPVERNTAGPSDDDPRRYRLRNSIQDLGITVGLSAKDALLASQAGFQGRERQFIHHANSLIRLGDFESLGEIIEKINGNARTCMSTLYWKPFDSTQQVVGN
jgi:hypothetical protein